MKSLDKKVITWAAKAILIVLVIFLMVAGIPALYNFDSTLFEILGYIAIICGAVLIYFIVRAGKGGEDEEGDDTDSSNSGITNGVS